MGALSAIRDAWPRHEEAAREALGIFKTYLALPIGEAPGCHTLPRMAVRISAGRTPEEAAGREYLYRWSLAIRSPIFGVPHTLGM